MSLIGWSRALQLEVVSALDGLALGVRPPSYIAPIRSVMSLTAWAASSLPSPPKVMRTS